MQYAAAAAAYGLAVQQLPPHTLLLHKRTCCSSVVGPDAGQIEELTPAISPASQQQQQQHVLVAEALCNLSKVLSESLQQHYRDGKQSPGYVIT
jgi:hypothetical protein